MVNEVQMRGAIYLCIGSALKVTRPPGNGARIVDKLTPFKRPRRYRLNG
jgi:hypothetical protein